MALYTLKSRDEVARMLSNSAVNNPQSQTIYNALGRNDGANQQNDNFFLQRGRSLENAFGTTGAAIASPIINEIHTAKTNELRNNTIADRDKIAQKYGYNTIDELYTALDNAEKTGDTATFNKLSEAEKEDRATTSANVDAMKAHNDSYKDYLENNYVSQKINQDRGKFAGSAIKTISTGVDVMLPAAGVATNAIQGGIEGVADELEQNGLENFDWGRAGQNAAIGATTGAITGALNKGINAKLAANGGNVFKGGNAVTKALNNFNANTKLGRVASTIGTGAARGAISGAAGGAVGAGMSSAMNGVELGQGIQNALEGGVKGATSGAITGGTMAGINMAANKIPIVNQLNKAQQDWQQSGDTTRERLANTWDSGDSKVANMVQNWQSGGDNFKERLATTMDSFRENNPASFTQKNWGIDNNAVPEPTPAGTMNVEQPAIVSSENIDNWDRIAREGGYASYDDVVKSFQDANPNAEVSAGAVLTWMDENPGNWNPNSTQKTQIYDALNGEDEATSNLKNTEDTNLSKRVPTSEEIKNKNALTEEIMSQFNAPDKPTVRATKPKDTFYTLYDEWGLSDGNDIRQAVSYADPDGLIPQMIREAAGEVGVIDLSDAQGMVMDLKINKQATSKMINALENIMDSTDTTIIGGKSGVDALQFQRTLEKMASDARGTNGTYRIGNSVVDETMARNFDRIARNIGDKLDQASVSKGAVKNVLSRHAGDIQNMRNTFANNPKWQDAVDKKVSGANNISDLRHSIKELTRANIFINNGDDNFATVGGRMAARNRDLPTTKNGVTNRLVNDVYDKIQQSKAARQARLAKYDKGVKDAQAKGTGANIENAPTTPITTTTNTLSPSTRIYDMIGRNAGNTAAENVQASDYINDVQKDLDAESTYMAPEGATTSSYGNTLEGLVAPTSNASTSVYDSITGTSSVPSFGSTEEERQVYFFRPTGDEWSDMLSRAMRKARNAGDEDAVAELFDMYQDAREKATAATTSASQTKLTDKQRQANAAARALADFEIAEPNFAYDVSDIPVIGGIANLGGNDYQSKAEALALQIGYMLSGATVNKDEAQKIGMAYVPQPRDNETVRKNKLAQLRGIISDYQQTYSE